MFKDPFKKQLQMFMGLTLLFFSGFYAAKASADINLVLPAYTKHLQYHTNKAYTENFDNTSVGLEWSNKHIDTGIVRVFKNSHSKKSIYTYSIAYPNQLEDNLKIGGGLLLAFGGYDTSALGSPVVAFRYKYVRLITTFPLGKLTNQNFDLLNIQLVIPLGD